MQAAKKSRASASLANFLLILAPFWARNAENRGRCLFGRRRRKTERRQPTTRHTTSCGVKLDLCSERERDGNAPCHVVHRDDHLHVLQLHGSHVDEEHDRLVVHGSRRALQNSRALRLRLVPLSHRDLHAHVCKNSRINAFSLLRTCLHGERRKCTSFLHCCFVPPREKELSGSRISCGHSGNFTWTRGPPSEEGRCSARVFPATLSFPLHVPQRR